MLSAGMLDADMWILCLLGVGVGLAIVVATLDGLATLIADQDREPPSGRDVGDRQRER
jgi:hypothetical protein